MKMLKVQVRKHSGDPDRAKHCFVLQRLRVVPILEEFSICGC